MHWAISFESCNRHNASGGDVAEMSMLRCPCSEALDVQRAFWAVRVAHAREYESNQPTSPNLKFAATFVNRSNINGFIYTATCLCHRSYASVDLKFFGKQHKRDSRIAKGLPFNQVFAVGDELYSQLVKAMQALVQAGDDSGNIDFDKNAKFVCDIVAKMFA